MFHGFVVQRYLRIYRNRGGCSVDLDSNYTLLQLSWFVGFTYGWRFLQSTAGPLVCKDVRLFYQTNSLPNRLPHASREDYIRTLEVKDHEKNSPLELLIINPYYNNGLLWFYVFSKRLWLFNGWLGPPGGIVGGAPEAVKFWLFLSCPMIISGLLQFNI